MEIQSMSVSLPLEIILDILMRLNYQDLLTCRRCSRWFCAIIDDDDFLQYKISLAISGMVDNPINQTPPTEKLARLENYRNWWMSSSLMDKSWSTDQKLTYPTHHGPAWELAGGVLAQSLDFNSIQFVRLPAKMRNITEKTWTTKLPCSHGDFRIDPVQDLLVIIERPLQAIGTKARLRLLTMSNAEEHPQSRVHTLEFPCRGVGNSCYEIRINGPYLGILSTDHRGSCVLTVWQWLTGEIIYRRYGMDQVSFVFLNDLYLLVALSEDTDFTAEHSHSRSPSPVLNLVSFRPNNVGLWNLRLPRPDINQVLFDDLELISEPGPLYSPQTTNVSPMFHISDTVEPERLVLLKMGAISTATFSFLASNIIEIPQKFPLHPMHAMHQSMTMMYVEWDSWAPGCLIEQPSGWLGHWRSIVFGTKHVFIRKASMDDEDIAADVFVRDFNPRRVRWEEVQRQQSGRQTIPDSKSITPFKNDNADNEMKVDLFMRGFFMPVLQYTFTEKIARSLAYMELCIPRAVSMRDQVILSEDAIVVVKNGGFVSTGFEVHIV
ncbi:hypothetical protein BDY19DRAFT_920721 [Irpex rosettiformis]|uniref:Uncharacterized protein n=1 Tax=Irpex rosettiformis TaxID=378272 RepID=A0ACB8UIK8_9APHY|nr:hypothetical protein BDY19DRAFT_920721 [Irpex rosettiformis]